MATVSPVEDLLVATVTIDASSAVEAGAWTANTHHSNRLSWEEGAVVVATTVLLDNFLVNDLGDDTMLADLLGHLAATAAKLQGLLDSEDTATGNADPPSNGNMTVDTAMFATTDVAAAHTAGNTGVAVDGFERGLASLETTMTISVEFVVTALSNNLVTLSTANSGIMSFAEATTAYSAVDPSSSHTATALGSIVEFGEFLVTGNTRAAIVSVERFSTAQTSGGDSLGGVASAMTEMGVDGGGASGATIEADSTMVRLAATAADVADMAAGFAGTTVDTVGVPGDALTTTARTMSLVVFASTHAAFDRSVITDNIGLTCTLSAVKADLCCSCSPAVTKTFGMFPGSVLATTAQVSVLTDRNTSVTASSEVSVHRSLAAIAAITTGDKSSGSWAFA